jgi:hypothetical protein
MIVTPSKNSNASGVDTENPVPETVPVAPTGPCPGVTVIASVVTVNVAGLVVFVVAPSVPTTAYGPGLSTGGTVNEHENPPVEFVVIVTLMNEPTEHPLGVKSTPLKAIIAPELSVNPEPITMKVLPTGP